MLPVGVLFLSRCAMLDYIVFLSCLEFAVLNSFYDEIFLKPKQVVCLDSMYLPTGYGKSLVFNLLLMLLFTREAEFALICLVGSQNILLPPQFPRLLWLYLH
jgi:hypothetical protein